MTFLRFRKRPPLPRGGKESRCAARKHRDCQSRRSAQLAIRVLQPRKNQVDFTSTPHKIVWQRVRRGMPDARISLTAQVSDTAEMIALALVITGDGYARFGRSHEDENEKP